VTISTTEKNTNVLKKISKLAGKNDKVKWTERAINDVLNTPDLTFDGVREAIVCHIDQDGKVHKTLTRDPPHTGNVVFEMLPVIDCITRYIKVALLEDGNLLVISAHNPQKGGENG
jgi:hypothetical protein